MDLAWGGPSMDLTTSGGFLAAVFHACSLKIGGAMLVAPVCSSFVFMRFGCIVLRVRVHPRNRGTSQRSATNPVGEERHQSVRTGNILLCRTLVIIWIAQALGCHWVLEQPKGSVMELHPRFQEVLSRLGVWKHTISMKVFGAPSLKPTWLYSSPLLINASHNAKRPPNKSY